MMYKLLPKSKCLFNDHASENSLATSTSTESDAVFAGANFWTLESSLGRVNGVVKTAAGYCGGTVRKPSYKEVCDGSTGHTEAVKVTYDNREISYKSLCDAFWETHDCTNKDFLNFGINTHQRSAIFYKTEEERKEAHESKIRKQMKLNRRIVTQIVPFEGDFFYADNKHQKLYMQKHRKLCESLGLRSTDQFVKSNIACKLNGILGLESTELVIEKLAKLVRTQELSRQSKSACEELIEELKQEWRK